MLEISWLAVMDVTGYWTLVGYAAARRQLAIGREWLARRQERRERTAIVEMESERQDQRPPPRIEPEVASAGPEAPSHGGRSLPLRRVQTTRLCARCGYASQWVLHRRRTRARGHTSGVPP